MATTIITKYGSGAPAASDVVRGELAVDTENGRLYTETSGGAVIEIGLKPSGNIDVTGTVTADGLTTSIGAGSAGSLNNQIAMTHTGASNSYHIKTIRASANDEPVGLAFVENTTERMRIDAGNVGIGTDLPGRNLEIAGTGTDVGLNITKNTVGTVRFAYDSTGPYILDEDSNPFRIYTGGSERMRIDSSGNVGIGVSSPTGLLTLGTGTFSAAAANTSALYTSTAAGLVAVADGFLLVDRAGADVFKVDTDGNLLVGKSSTAAGAGVIIGASGVSNFTADGDRTLILNRETSDGNILEFRKNNATVGNIGTNSSNVYISGATRGLHFTGTAGIIPCNEAGAARDADTDLGKSDTRFKDLYLSGRVVANGVTTSAHAWSSESDSTSSSAHLYFRNPNGFVGSISTSGTATAYNTSSDYRLKENVVAMSGATERLKQLAPKRFNFIADADTTVDGFLAHEVADVVPEAVTGAKDAVDAEGNPEYQGIDQSKLVPLLVATIQELEARIAQLEGAN